MSNVNFTTTCSAASWPMAFCGLAVTRARKSCCCPSVASGARFVRRVRAGVWPRPRPTWSSASSPGCRHGNGWCPCLCPYDIGCPHQKSVLQRIPTGISCIPSPRPGQTARLGSHFRRWNSWRSWQPWYPCRGSTWCGMGAVWRRTAAGAARSLRRCVNRAWRRTMPQQSHLAGAGRGS